MSAAKFLFLYRNPVEGTRRSPSPEEMQAMFAQWKSWKTKFEKEVVDMGDGLKPNGAVLKAGHVTDGPYVESKEVMGGYSIIAADSLARALEIAKECPMNHVPGASIEVRELSGF